MVKRIDVFHRDNGVAVFVTADNEDRFGMYVKYTDFDGSKNAAEEHAYKCVMEKINEPV